MKCKNLKSPLELAPIYRRGWGFIFLILLVSCKQKREVYTSFYFWKTVYQTDTLQQHYVNHFKNDKLFVRIMDVDRDEHGVITPIAPINFKDKLPNNKALVPVVFIVNDILKTIKDNEISELAANIMKFVNGKVKQSGKLNYHELQIDCDWTASTRLQYFKLLEEIQKLNSGRKLSTTLRLHQLKNQEKSGIPPVDHVLLMCYNMGNLRKYGTQNSILEVAELKKYLDKNLKYYPMKIDIGLPLFSWAVVFRNKAYAGISKRMNIQVLSDKGKFEFLSNGLYRSKINLPTFGLNKNDEIRYEQSKLEELKECASYIEKYLPQASVNLVLYHLDKEIIKNFSIHELEEITHILR